MKKILIVIIFLIFSYSCFSQQIFILRENQRAYNKSTRSFTGTPGRDYWQNSSDYKINASVNPIDATITGDEQITYTNNSPDTLKYLLFNIYANLYKKGSRSVIDIEPSDLNDGMKINSISINNEDYTFDNNNINGTIFKMKLPTPMPPSSNLIIGFNWSVSLPKTTFNKIGAYSSTDIFAGLWYPKICVYDDVSGWNNEQYTGLAEFYNEFGNYDIKIKLPAGYFCWATGTLQNAKNILRTDIYEKYNEAQKSEDVIHILKKEDYSKGLITKTKDYAEWHYKAENVSDFAFGISNHYLYDGVCATLKNKKVFVSAAYNSNSKDFYEVAEIAKKSIISFSENFPGIEYPFPQITVYNGYDGMEFPMIINDGAFERRSETVYVTTHEILHQYIPFLAGTDETRYGWMDESFAVFIPESMQTAIEPTLRQADAQKRFYGSFSGKRNDIPLMIPSYNLTPEQYFGVLYGKSERALTALEALIGREKLKLGIKTFIEEWSYKHPTPYDFFFTIDRINTESLSWFWQKWYFEYSGIRYDVGNIEKTTGGYTINIRNTGGAPAEYTLIINYDDGTKEEIKGVPFRGETNVMEIATEKNITKAEIL